MEYWIIGGAIAIVLCIIGIGTLFYKCKKNADKDDKLLDSTQIIQQQEQQEMLPFSQDMKCNEQNQQQMNYYQDKNKARQPQNNNTSQRQNEQTKKKANSEDSRNKNKNCSNPISSTSQDNKPKQEQDEVRLEINSPKNNDQVLNQPKTMSSNNIDKDCIIKIDQDGNQEQQNQQEQQDHNQYKSQHQDQTQQQPCIPQQSNIQEKIEINTNIDQKVKQEQQIPQIQQDIYQNQTYLQSNIAQKPNILEKIEMLSEINNFNNLESLIQSVKKDICQKENQFQLNSEVVPKISFKPKIEIIFEVDQSNTLNNSENKIRYDSKRPKPDDIIIPLAPNPPPNSEDIGDMILPLYEKTSKKRQIEDQYKYYVRQLKNKVDLKKNYSLSLQANKEMGNYCNAFREVRGDGNCFYTAFGYQFLSILLFDYSIDQFYKFIEKIKQINLPMKIYVTGQDFKIDDKLLEEKLLKEFLNRLMKLKQIQDLVQRKEQFHNQFAAYEKQSEEVDACLYGLSTIFFRNYSNYIVDFSEKKDALYDRENLLKWEEECNSNEVIIAELAKQLNIFVQLIFIENKDQLKKFQYGNEQHNKIILLIKPGHYNIGYFIQETINI